MAEVEKMAEEDLSNWFSTYGLLTSKQLLERFGVFLNDNELVKAAKDTESAYYILLRVPIRNVFNGIILQQAQDYQTYAQKLLIDYLLSGENAKAEDQPGATTREDIELTRTQLQSLNEAFEHATVEHKQLIAKSQAQLIALAQQLKIGDHHELKIQIKRVGDAFLEEAGDMSIKMRNFRRQFYDFIVNATALISHLPDYQMDETKKLENLSAIQFDPNALDDRG